MAMTRRGFLKLAAAGAAVAIVPVKVVEAIAPLAPDPVKPAADATGRRLWQVWEQRWSEIAGDFTKLDLELAAGSCRIELGIYVDAGTSINFMDFDGIELDLRMVAGTLQIFIDDKPALGVYRLIVRVERPMKHFVLGDYAVQARVGEADVEPLKKLTAYKQLRGDG